MLGNIEWIQSTIPVAYPEALSFMDSRVAAIHPHKESECVWLLEHPHCYTAGTSANVQDLLQASAIPVYETGRGGQYTYHGPGQRIGYVLLNLIKRKIDIRDYVCRLEKWLIATLADFNINGELRDGRIGVWVQTKKGDQKIAALGVRVRRGIAFHGVSLNVNPDLSFFNGIVPCGLKQYGVTSFADLGVSASLEQIDQSLRYHFDRIVIA